MDTFPLLSRLEKEADTILLAGAGGGYDIYCGLPLYFHLREKGKQVILANLSFSAIEFVEGERLTPDMLEVTAESHDRFNYFPEKYLCQWLEQELGEKTSIFCFERTGAAPIAEAYESLVSEYEVDTVVLVDGGTDSLMRGDEPGLGTPQEDIASIAAVDALELDRKFLVCLGFGIDYFHGVCHYHFLEAVAELTRKGAFLGAMAIPPDSEEARLYGKASEYTFEKMPHHPSIVNSSILAALAGEYGDYHPTERTSGSKLWINPIMTFYWAFELGAVARRCLYLNDIRDSRRYAGLDAKIGAFRERLDSVKGWEHIPV